MKTNLNRMIPLFCFIFLLFINSVVAQTPSSSAAPVSNEQSNSPVAAAPPAMSEDDHLTFMQDERQTGAAESNTSGMLLRTLGAMLLIVGLIFFGAWGVKKFGANFGLFQASNVVKPDAPDLTVLNSVSLGAGRSLVVVRFGERNLLVGSTAQSFTLLADDETNIEQTGVRRSRSVADLLAEENNSFADELDSADERLTGFGNQQV